MDENEIHSERNESQNDAPPPPERIIEAMLFVGGDPLTAERACEIVRGLTKEQFYHAIDSLNREYREQARSYAIVSQGPGFVLSLVKRFRGVIERLYGAAKEAHLSQSAIDVLALVAYRQPVTKREVDTLRGYESASVLRQLVRRNLIAVVQRGQAGHQEVAYGTTSRFLELFGLHRLDDLPQTQELKEV